MPRTLRRRGDEDLGAGDDLEPAGMVLTDPHLVEAQRIQMFDQQQIAMKRLRRVLVHGVKRRMKDAELQIAVRHKR